MSKSKILDLKQGSQEWLDARKGKITASIVANCIGVKGAFKSPKEQALIIRGLKEDIPSDYAKSIMQKGLDEEKSIRAWSKERWGFDIEPKVFINRALNPFFLASLDGINEVRGIYEFKYSNSEYEQVKEHNKPSLKYLTQVRFQMAVANSPLCRFVVKNHAGEYEFCIVFRDLEKENEILKKLDNFIETYLLSDDWLADSLDDNNEALEIVSKLRDLKEKLKPLQDEEKALKAKLLEIADGRECECNGAKISKSERTVTDYKSFVKDNKLKITDDYITKSIIWRVNL